MDLPPIVGGDYSLADTLCHILGRGTSYFFSMNNVCISSGVAVVVLVVISLVLT